MGQWITLCPPPLYLPTVARHPGIPLGLASFARLTSPGSQSSCQGLISLCTGLSLPGWLFLGGDTRQHRAGAHSSSLINISDGMESKAQFFSCGAVFSYSRGLQGSSVVISSLESPSATGNTSMGSATPRSCSRGFGLLRLYPRRWAWEVSVHLSSQPHATALL